MAVRAMTRSDSQSIQQLAGVFGLAYGSGLELHLCDEEEWVIQRR